MDWVVNALSSSFWNIFLYFCWIKINFHGHTKVDEHYKLFATICNAECVGLMQRSAPLLDHFEMEKTFVVSILFPLVRLSKTLHINDITHGKKNSSLLYFQLSYDISVHFGKAIFKYINDFFGLCAIELQDSFQKKLPQVQENIWFLKDVRFINQWAYSLTILS